MQRNAVAQKRLLTPAEESVIRVVRIEALAYVIVGVAQSIELLTIVCKATRFAKEERVVVDLNGIVLLVAELRTRLVYPPVAAIALQHTNVPVVVRVDAVAAGTHVALAPRVCT